MSDQQVKINLLLTLHICPNELLALSNCYILKSRMFECSAVVTLMSKIVD